MALLVPFAYFFGSRVPTARRKWGWFFSYLLPVLCLSVAAHGGWQGVLHAVPMLVAVYAAYEFGYLVNDTVAVEREANPTLRVDEDMRQWLRARLPQAFVARAAVGVVCLGGLAVFASPPVSPILVLGWFLVWACFALYNHWRGHITIALHLALTSLRFLLPIAAALRPGSVLPPAALLLLLYPLPNSFEAAWKPRYGLSGLRRRFGNEHRFRAIWHVLALLAAIAWALAAGSIESRIFAVACAYYLLLRSVGSWIGD